jgi:hypothetical protein
MGRDLAALRAKTMARGRVVVQAASAARRRATVCFFRGTTVRPMLQAVNVVCPVLHHASALFSILGHVHIRAQHRATLSVRQLGINHFAPENPFLPGALAAVARKSVPAGLRCRISHCPQCAVYGAVADRPPWVVAIWEDQITVSRIGVQTLRTLRRLAWTRVQGGLPSSSCQPGPGHDRAHPEQSRSPF